MKHEGRGFEILGYTVLGIFSLTCIIPFLILFSGSITDEVAITAKGFSIFPRDIGFTSYVYMSHHLQLFIRSMLTSFAVTFLGMVLHVTLAMTLAYPLSKADLPGRSILSFIVILTLLLNGGLVPTYIVYTRLLHIKNTFWALLIPALLLNGFNVTLMRNYYKQSVPESMLEAARIDGAGEWKIFSSIVVPVSKPMMTTIALMSAMGYWNDWNNGLYYITDQNKMGLQSILNSIIQNAEFLTQNSMIVSTDQVVPIESLRMAVALVAAIPMVIAYFCMQKYFIVGITMGAIKE